MLTLFSQIARAIARVFAPSDSDLVAVGFQPITDDIYRRGHSACYASDLEL